MVSWSVLVRCRSGTKKPGAYTPEHYRALRNGRYPIPERTEKAILDHAFDLGLHEPSSSLRAAPSIPTEPEEVSHELP